MAKLNTIAFKVTDEQEAFIRRTAAARNISVSELIRDAVMALETKPDAEYWKRFRDLRCRVVLRNKGKPPLDFKKLINQGRKY